MFLEDLRGAVERVVEAVANEQTSRADAEQPMSAIVRAATDVMDRTWEDAVRIVGPLVTHIGTGNDADVAAGS
jgi:hypothetical protein